MEKYYFLKCPLFDRVRVEAPPSIIASSSFTIGSKASIKDSLAVIKSSPFKTVFVIDEANKKSIFAITQNIDLVNESRKRKGGGGGEPGPFPPSPAEECCSICLSGGADGCLVLENLDCYCLYTGGGGGGTRDIDTNDDSGSLGRLGP
jgi:hypothetical protein